MQYPSLPLIQTHSLSYIGHHCISTIKKWYNLKLSNEVIIQLSKIKHDSHSLLSLPGTLLKTKISFSIPCAARRKYFNFNLKIDILS